MAEMTPQNTATGNQYFRAGNLIRTTLEPLWWRLQDHYSTFGITPHPPEIASTDMCRHTCLYALRAFKDAGLPIGGSLGWYAMSGDIDPDQALRSPDHAGDGKIPHWWLVNDRLGWLDLTADQFGFAPVLFGAAKDPFFAAYEDDWPGSLKAQMRTVLNWEGDTRGTWAEGDLEINRQRRADLVSEIAGIFAPEPDCGHFRT